MPPNWLRLEATYRPYGSATGKNGFYYVTIITKNSNSYIPCLWPIKNSLAQTHPPNGVKYLFTPPSLTGENELFLAQQLGYTGLG